MIGGYSRQTKLSILKTVLINISSAYPFISPTKSDNFGNENEQEVESPKKPLARTNSGKRKSVNKKSTKPEELLVDSAESLDLGPSDLTWNKWEEKLDSEQQEKVQDEPSKSPVLVETEPNDKQAEVLKENIETMADPEKDSKEKITPVTAKNDEEQMLSAEVPKSDDVKQVPEPPSQSDTRKEFSDEDNELMIDENFGAGQEFLKFRNRSLDNDDATANGPISDILENAAALSGVSPESDSKTEITNDFEIEKVETMDECIEISDEDDDEPITKLIQSNKKPQTGKLRNF